MKDTIIVFVGIAILLLAPLFFYGGRWIIISKQEKDFRYLYYRLGIAVLGCIALLALLINVYNFTIRYQAPLVAEGFLVNKGYHYLEEMGFDLKAYTPYLSENIYEDEDGTIRIYSWFESSGEDIYTEIRMKQNGDGWVVLNHEIIPSDPEEYPEIKKRFYPIRGNS